MIAPRIQSPTLTASSSPHNLQTTPSRLNLHAMPTSASTLAQADDQEQVPSSNKRMRQASPSPTDQELSATKRRRDPTAGSDVRFFDWHSLCSSPSSNSIMSDGPSTFTPSSLIAGCNPGVLQPRPPTCTFNPPLSRPPVPVNVHIPATSHPLNLPSSQPPQDPQRHFKRPVYVRVPATPHPLCTTSLCNCALKSALPALNESELSQQREWEDELCTKLMKLAKLRND
jgi:hypothetical protein